MTDDQQGKGTQASQQSQNFATDISERPLNPTRNAADLFGDTSGMTGITQGSPQQTSAEPTDKVQDNSEIRGGSVINANSNPTGIPKEAVSDKVYDHNTANGRSSVVIQQASDDASDDTNSLSPNSAGDAPVSSNTPVQTQPADFGKQTNTAFPETQDAPYLQPENEGEQDAAGGTTPDPRSDDDTLAMAQRGGFQMNEDTEHPQPIDAGRDIDQAEQGIKAS